jgi:anti-sigma factor RsiW
MHPTDLTLNEYAEGGLEAIERADIERHLQRCPVCRDLADDLTAIRRDARSLGPLTPPPDAWDRIRSAWAAAGPEGRRNHPALGWLAAAAALVLAILVGVLATWREPGDGPLDTRELAARIAAELREAEGHYQKAIAGLEQIAEAERGALDPQTIATLEASLATIDAAIRDSRAAIDADPDNVQARLSLLDGFRNKMALLQDAVALIGQSKTGIAATASGSGS